MSKQLELFPPAEQRVVWLFGPRADDEHILAFIRSQGRITTMALASRYGWTPAEAIARLNRLRKAGLLHAERASVAYVSNGRLLSWEVRDNAAA